MTESVVLQFRTTKYMRQAVKRMTCELRKRGLADSESMSQYIKRAIKEKLKADSATIEKSNQNSTAIT